MAEEKWYVVHTYSGYENKVKVDIEKTLENNKSLAERIHEVRIPTEEVVEIKNGQKKTVTHKLWPGYVLVNMDLDDETWYVVRNTRGVTGFVGPGGKATPLAESEMRSLGVSDQPKDKIKIDFEVGDTIAVITGVWKDTSGVVTKIDENKQTATINVELFGRETPVEIGFAEVRRMS